MCITKLVLVRHGESKWNCEGKFTGWTDIDLSKKGRIESKKAGKILKEKGYVFSFAYSSVLKRAIHTLWNILDELDQSWIPIEKSWRLNERHYGALQGLKKSEMIEKYGDHQVQMWRRSYSTIPPKLSLNDERFPGNDVRYANLKRNELPVGESLELATNRILPYWKKVILPRIMNREKIIVSTHGNSIRSIIKFLDNLSEEEILTLDIPTGVPLVYEFNEKIEPVKRYYLIQ